MIDSDKLQIEKLVDFELYKQSLGEADFDVSDLDKPIVTEFVSMKFKFKQFLSPFDILVKNTLMKFLNNTLPKIYKKNFKHILMIYLKVNVKNYLIPKKKLS